MTLPSTSEFVVYRLKFLLDKIWCPRSSLSLLSQIRPPLLKSRLNDAPRESTSFFAGTVTLLKDSPSSDPRNLLSKIAGSIIHSRSSSSTTIGREESSNSSKGLKSPRHHIKGKQTAHRSPPPERFSISWLTTWPIHDSSKLCLLHFAHPSVMPTNNLSTFVVS